MSFFDVKPCSFSTSTSIHSPWQSKPFWYRCFSPSIVWKRWYRSLYVRPHAWCTPIGLFAVIGPSMNDHRRSDASLRWRYFSIIPCSRHHSSVRFSISTNDGLLDTGFMCVLRALRFGQQKARPTYRDGPNRSVPAVPPLFSPAASAHRAPTRPALLTGASGSAYVPSAAFSGPAREGSSAVVAASGSHHARTRSAAPAAYSSPSSPVREV